MTDRPRARRPAPRPDLQNADLQNPDLPLSGLSLAIRVQSRRWRELPELRQRVTRATQAALAVAAIAPRAEAELSLLLTDDARMQTINRDWRGFDKATNVLSFPAAPPERIGTSPVLGDIVLAYETLDREATADGKSLADHLSHLVIHGVLHLLGEDHETDAQAQRMEGLEIAALARLGIADPYAGSEPDAPPPAPAEIHSPAS